MKFSKKILSQAAFAFLLLAAIPAVYLHAEQAQTQKYELKSEKHSEVCMATNTVAGRPMIPVTVEGKTYYGCCAGCSGKLKSFRDIRYAKDPVTGKEVDKAKAFILADANRKAVYFESRETAEKFIEYINSQRKQ